MGIIDWLCGRLPSDAPVPMGDGRFLVPQGYKAVEIEKIVYVDRVVTGQEYVWKLWRHAVETADSLRGQPWYTWQDGAAWNKVATDIYTVMARPWFEEDQNL